MGVTANYSLPYPELTSADNVPADVKALADKVDLELNGLVRPPYIRVHSTASSTVFYTASQTGITFHAETGIHDPAKITWASGSGNVTIIKPGIYMVVGSVGYNQDSLAKSRTVRIRKNGTTFAATRARAVTDATHIQAVSDYVSLIAGDSIDLTAAGTSDPSVFEVNTLINSDSTFLSVRWVGLA